MKRVLRAPINYGDIPREQDLPPPLLGADTDAVLREIGLTDAEINAAIPTKSKRT